MLSSSVAQEPARAISPLPSPGPASAAEPGAGSTPSSTWSTGWKARPAAAVRDVWPTISSASTSSCSTNWATCLSPRRRAAAVPSDQPALRAHVDHRHHQPRFRRMAERVRGCKDDDSTPRSSHPSLRDHRDRQRVLALQEPRLTVPPACPGGQTGNLPRAPLRRSWGTPRHARVPPVRYLDKRPTISLAGGPFCMPIRGPVSMPIDRHDVAYSREGDEDGATAHRTAACGGDAGIAGARSAVCGAWAWRDAVEAEGVGGRYDSARVAVDVRGLGAGGG